ncbi:hypothetical protein POM88_009450 [Heracleum sosnowskyi]|uniref:Uncharacterized protein n=1 Tax=Heracleum sosnowskyi TaxID=360622 RepID=A0AAD8N875_9APIA|nr:hypothetical protein POM88_009450 [Heracleum sosnowskyi]
MANLIAEFSTADRRAMFEPFSIGVPACCLANVGGETNVLISGARPIGVVAMLVPRAFGAPRIMFVDVDDCRLSLAKEVLMQSLRMFLQKLNRFRRLRGLELMYVLIVLASLKQSHVDCVPLDQEERFALWEWVMGSRYVWSSALQENMASVPRDSNNRKIDGKPLITQYIYGFS